MDTRRLAIERRLSISYLSIRAFLPLGESGKESDKRFKAEPKVSQRASVAIPQQ